MVLSEILKNRCSGLSDVSAHSATAISYSDTQLVLLCWYFIDEIKVHNQLTLSKRDFPR